MKEQHFTLPDVVDSKGRSWVYIRIGQELVAKRRGVQRSGWDMVEEYLVVQLSLEPREGFGR